MNRLAYADTHREQYLDWAAQVANGPATPSRRMEFAILSANTQFDHALALWREIRHVDPRPVVAAAFGEARAQAVFETRAHPDRYPVPDYYEYRNRVKLPGLGYSKHSFAACLIDPNGSSIICLDTHMAKCYNVKARKLFDSPNLYKRIEAQVLREAAALDLPPFVYQWATWDWQRGKVEDHNFLWWED